MKGGIIFIKFISLKVNIINTDSFKPVLSRPSMVRVKLAFQDRSLLYTGQFTIIN